MSQISSEHLELAFSNMVRLAEAKFENVEKINIRLYGGWYKETSLTKQASTIQQLLFGVSVFPKVKDGKIIQGAIELVSSLFDIPDFVWGYTHKETNGIKRIRVNHDCVDTMCNVNRENCPKFIIYKFTDKKDKKCKVSGCDNLQKDVFKGIEQKMIDTLIACDILSISDDIDITGIVVISDDQDHLPSLALAKKKQEAKESKNLQGIILGIQNERNLDFVRDFLQPFDIHIELLQ